MPLTRRSVSGFTKRDVYKTEFDIFKRSTDIDLISLISYNDDEGKRKTQTKKSSTDRARLSRAQSTVGTRDTKSARSLPLSSSTKRFTERRQATKSAQLPRREISGESRFHRTDPTVRIRNARTKVETEIYKDFAKTTKTFLKSPSVSAADRRNCKSALDVRRSGENRNELTRSQTTCGFHSGSRSRVSSSYISHSGDKSNTNTKQTQSKFKPTENKNLVTSVNNAWRARTASRYRRIETNVNKQITRETRDKSESKRDNIRTDQRIHTSVKTIVSADTELETEAEVVKEVTGNSEVFHVSESVTSGDLNKSTVEVESKDIDVENQLEKREGVHNDDTVNVSVDANRTEVVEDTYDTVDGFIELKSEINDRETQVDEIDGHEDFFASKDSGIDSHVLSPDCINTSEPDSESIDEESSERRVKFRDDASELLLVPENSEDLQLDSISNIDIPFSEAVSEFSDEEIEVANEETGYDINDLINDLERFGNQSRLSLASLGVRSLLGGPDDVNSLCCESARKIEKPLEVTEEHVETKEIQPVNLDDFTMSREARHAILETLNEMGVKKSSKGSAQLNDGSLHRAVMVQKRLKENRMKYDHLLREKTRSTQRSRLKSIDSLGNEEASTQYSSPTIVHKHGFGNEMPNDAADHSKLFPSIVESSKPTQSKKTSRSKAKIYSLEHVNNKKYTIPGIGQYNLVTSPESDFEITPPGFDSRYNPQPIISKEEMEIPARFIRERSIQKCERWLTRVNMSPLSLKPVKNKSLK